MQLNKETKHLYIDIWYASMYTYTNMLAPND